MYFFFDKIPAHFVSSGNFICGETNTCYDFCSFLTLYKKMKTTQILSLFLFGLFVTGMVQAQAADGDMPMMAEPKMMMEEELPPMDMMMRDGMGDRMGMEKMMGEHEGCAFSKMGKCGENNGDCPMMKMMDGEYGYHHGGGSIFYGIVHGICMLVFLFLGAFVIRKGWKMGGCCGGKACKK